MSTENTIDIDSVMSQAQVFASAWSLVGGTFDSGNAMEQAEEAKAELREMLTEFLSNTELRTVAEQLIKWHSNKMSNVQALLDAPKDMEIRFGEDEQLVLTGDMAKGFRVAMHVTRQWFGTFPLSIDQDEDAAR
ncbi:MAG: host nuclease inhibitor protein [Pseudomonas marincola]|jgi:hypothetical protein|uniref:host nuclease inhibitor protein n=1 Tax=Pseudomonas marincola TaxID=437900 RepID=UPI003001BDC4